MFSPALAAYGAKVLCIDRDLPSAWQTADGITEAGGAATAHRVDIQDEAPVKDFAQLISRSATPLDILVNNAGVANVPTRVHEMDDDTWNSAVAINLTATFRCTRALLPAMITRGRGSIINISSIMSVTGFYRSSAAAATNQAFDAAVLSGTTIGRRGHPEELRGLIVPLASDGSS